jgi:predicted metal-dependent phosphoesterase TrpH
MGELFEVVGNLHMHTPYSDGEKWHAEIAADAISAGLDFVIVTDHNIWVDGVEGYYENERGRVLLIVGEEVHNVRRVPQASHFLVYGAEKEMCGYAADPQRLIDETNAAGAFGFLAHPYEKDLPIFNEMNLGWHDWEIEGFTGLEIWNYMSCVKNLVANRLEKLPFRNKLLGQLAALRVALNPDRFILGPEPEALILWDKLLSEGKRISAVGNSDAHGTMMSLGPIKRVIYPYDFLFRAVNTHVLSAKPLNGDLSHDKQMILQAIGSGRSWVGYDMISPTLGFRFSGHGTERGMMGDSIQLDVGATLQVRTPVRAGIRLIRGGEIVAEAQQETHLTHIPVEAGAYRVECRIPYRGKERGWIFSNPIYLY